MTLSALPVYRNVLDADDGSVGGGGFDGSGRRNNDSNSVDCQRNSKDRGTTGEDGSLPLWLKKAAGQSE